MQFRGGKKGGKMNLLMKTSRILEAESIIHRKNQISKFLNGFY